MTAARMPSWEDVVADELCVACNVRPKKSRDLCGLCHMVTYGDIDTKPTIVITTSAALSDPERRRILRAVDEATAREQTAQSKLAAARTAAASELEALGHDGSELEERRTSLHPSLIWGAVVVVGAGALAVITALANLR